MFLDPKSLQLSCLGVFDDVYSFVDGDAVVKGRSRSRHFYRTVGNNLWAFPAMILGPVDAEHVIRKEATKDELLA